MILCRHAPEVTYEALQADVQAHLGISRDRLGGVLTSLAGARKRLPRDVDYPIERDKDLRRYRIEPVAAELLLAAVERARAAGLVLPHRAVLGARVGLGVRASSIAGPLQGVASGVTRKLHSTLGGAELLVDDLQRSLHRIGTEATDAVVKWMVEELQEEQHRHDHRNHGPHE